MILRRDPVGPLLAAGHPALDWCVRHDLLGEELNAESLWGLPRVTSAERRQNPDGSWSYRGGKLTMRTAEDYAQIATYEQMLGLVSQYRLDRRHPMVERAAGCLLAHQRAEGDIRGIYGSQYTPNYTADILRVLIEAGYGDDARVLAGLDWLVSMRQDDGGWAIPLRTVGNLVYAPAIKLPQPLEPNRSRSSSHLITGIVLRALAAHPSYRHRTESVAAAELLARRFFTNDVYNDRRDASYWTKLAFPFRWTDLVSALDTIAQVGLDRKQVGVAKGLRWMAVHQAASGLWRCGYPNHPDPLIDHWVTFGAVRMLARFYGAEALTSRRPAAALHRASA